MRMHNKAVAVAALSVSMFLTGCNKPFDTPEFADVDTSETAFLIPIEGDTANQAKFQSIDFLEHAKAATKRIQIPHRWCQTGYYENEGSWIPTAKLVKVKRSPVTRTWTADTSTGTSAKNEAVSVESADSINFSMGWTCTAMITEDDTAKFLYYYPAGSLDDVMDSEVLARIESTTQDVCGKYNVDQVRHQKDEIHKTVFNDLTTFYKSRGITITNVGIVGGFTYADDAIQKAMDDAAVSANLSEIERQKLLAQQVTNDRLTAEATGKANALKLEAEGEATAKVTEAKAEADSITLKAKAMKDAGEALIQLKQLEIEQARVEKWNGQYPTFLMGSGGGNFPIMTMPLPTPATVNK